MHIAEIRRRRGDIEKPRSKIAVRIANERNGEELNKTTRAGRAHTVWLTPTARLAGIHIGGTGKM